jgi:hypothetical protein
MDGNANVPENAPESDKDSLHHIVHRCVRVFSDIHRSNCSSEPCVLCGRGTRELQRHSERTPRW